MSVSVNGTSGLTFNDATTQNTSAFYGGLAFRNRIINGAMMIDQRNAGASVTPTNGQYLVDRFTYNATQASKVTAQQNAGSVTPPVGFSSYQGITSSSAYSVVASDYFILQQRIEGLNMADLAWGTASAATVTLSFWVRSSLTGTFGGSVYNSAFDRSYPFTYTIISANTWEQKSVTIAGPTAGTWTISNSAYMAVSFSLGAGSTYSGAAGSWSSSAYFTATGATSVVGTSGATFYITGVQLEKGSTATSFDYRPYGTELALCQRYYYNWTQGYPNEGVAVGQNYNTTDCYPIIYLKVPMRTQPSATVSAGGTFSKLGGAAWGGASIAATGPQTISLLMTTTGLVSGGAQNVLGTSSVVPFVITASAEL